jgi:hypothetical protein
MHLILHSEGQSMSEGGPFVFNRYGGTVCDSDLGTPAVAINCQSGGRSRRERKPCAVKGKDEDDGKRKRSSEVIFAAPGLYPPQVLCQTATN